MVIRVVDPDKRQDLTIRQYVVWYLNNVNGEAFVHEMFRDFTIYSSKRPMKYTSFRTEVSWLAKNKEIVLSRREIDKKNPNNPFRKSYYRLP